MNINTAIPNATDTRTEMSRRYAEACPDLCYTTHLLSANPPIMYAEDMVTKEEAEYLLVLAELYYMASSLPGPMSRTYDNEYRKSVSAVVPDDPVVSCIRKRAADFQGFLPVDHVEDIQRVKYGKSDLFRPHFESHQGMLNPRISTFFVYLACDDPIDGGSCEGGETGLPRWSGCSGPSGATWASSIANSPEKAVFTSRPLSEMLSSGTISTPMVLELRAFTTQECR